MLLALLLDNPALDRSSETHLRALRDHIITDTLAMIVSGGFVHRCRAMGFKIELVTKSGTPNGERGATFRATVRSPWDIPVHVTFGIEDRVIAMARSSRSWSQVASIYN